MLNVLCASALCALSLYGLRRFFTDGLRVVFRGFDGRGALAGFVVSIAASAVLGPVNGLAAVLALLLHETGRWLALNALGLPEPAFRLMPALTGRRPPPLPGDAARALHALMGPAAMLPPMVLSLALSMVTGGAPAEFLRALALCCCGLGCLWLMPLRGLDGGALASGISRVLPGPGMAVAVAPLLLGALALWRLAGIDGLTLALVLLPAVILLARPSARGAPMSHAAARLALAGWSASFLTCLSGLVILGAV